MLVGTFRPLHAGFLLTYLSSAFLIGRFLLVLPRDQQKIPFPREAFDFGSKTVFLTRAINWSISRTQIDVKEPAMDRTWLSRVGSIDRAYEDPWVMFCIPKLALLHKGGKGGNCTAMIATALTAEAPKRQPNTRTNSPATTTY